jgi:hypothetical protein
MKVACRMMMLGLALVFAVAVTVRAAEKDKKPAAKTVTLKGEITCSKCDLKETAACGNVIVVEKDGKKVTYYFIDKGAKETYHKNICRGGKKGSVKGVVSKKGGKMYIKPAKNGVKFD